jgi:integrase
MVERPLPATAAAAAAAPKPRRKRKANRRRLTETSVLRLPVSKTQHFVWDRGTNAVRGLCVQVNPSGTRTYFVNYRFPGSKRLHYKKLGRVGEMELEEAREEARKVRRLAHENKNPKAGDPYKSDSFETVFKSYIQREQKGRKQNSSADATCSVVLFNCAELKPRAVATVEYSDISSLLDGIRDGAEGKRPRPATAARLHAHLGDFFRWCARERIIKESPMLGMPSPATVAARDRHFSDAELKAIWAAADKVPSIDGSYVKLMMLLALRRDELAEARWSEFDNPTEPTLFVVPSERVKMKALTKIKKHPTYKVPLPPLAVRILKGLRREGELLFPGLDVRKLTPKLVKLGAPKDFKLHVFRHTIATRLQTEGKSEWEIGLVLNHASGGTVTGGYSHGYPIELKRTLLTEWASHVERLVSPGKGIARLR